MADSNCGEPKPNVSQTCDESQGTSCTITAPDDGVCDGEGTCVECVSNGDCASGLVCSTATHECIVLFDPAATCVGFTTCGDSCTYGGKTYGTVQLGTRCWFTENLNFGNFVAEPASTYGSNQSDNGILEKSCYNNNEANCDLYGALYKDGEAMNYGLNPTPANLQGICPAGWHVPSVGDWNLMESVVSNVADLSTGGASGFDLQWSGIKDRNTSSVGFSGKDTIGYFWSTHSSMTDQAWSIREFQLGGTTYLPGFNYSPKPQGVAIRCVKEL